MLQVLSQSVRDRWGLEVVADADGIRRCVSRARGVSRAIEGSRAVGSTGNVAISVGALRE